MSNSSEIVPNSKGKTEPQLIHSREYSPLICQRNAPIEWACVDAKQLDVALHTKRVTNAQQGAVGRKNRELCIQHGFA